MQISSNFLIAPQNRFKDRRQNHQPNQQQNPYDSYFLQKSFESGSRSVSSGSRQSQGLQKSQKVNGKNKITLLQNQKQQKLRLGEQQISNNLTIDLLQTGQVVKEACLDRASSNEVCASSPESIKEITFEKLKDLQTISDKNTAPTTNESSIQEPLFKLYFEPNKLVYHQSKNTN